jgi:cytochrome c
MRRSILLLALTLPLWAAQPAFAVGDAKAGWELANQRCSQCHTIDSAGAGIDAAPPFSRIAKDWGQDRKWLKSWLTNPHPQMPEMNLSPLEIEDVIAYLESLSKE